MSTPESTVVDSLLAETIERLLAASCSFEVVEQAEIDGWCPAVWEALAEAGFPWISVDEAAGGSGGSLVDALEVVRAVGRHGAPVPMAETALLGGWLAAAAGFEISDGPLTVVLDGHALEATGGRIRGRAVVPWARRADAILALVDGRDGTLVISVAPDQLTIVARTNMAGEPRDDVEFDLAIDAVQATEAPAGVDAATLMLRGCLSRVVLSAGALAAASQLTVDYTNERFQFGRPVASFQAVQHHLVNVAQCAVRASMAADVAIRAFATGSDPTFAVAAARVVVDAAAVDGTRAAHQAHGAIGVAREYRLHHLTRRLWSWRHEFGSARTWRRSLGHEVAAGGAEGLFATIAR